MRSILSSLRVKYPDISFKEGDDFHWSPSLETIFYVNNTPFDNISLIHELAHALLGHSTFDRDIDLLKMERSAWDRAKLEAPVYDIKISDDIIEDSLDSYRDWLHSRSTCPNCSAIGIQTGDSTYKCVACGASWRVNDARDRQLRRHVIA